MKKVMPVQTERKEGLTILTLGGNHNVIQVTAELSAIEKECDLLCKYAQNGIVDELVFFGSCAAGEPGQITFSVEVPVEASHIYLYSQEAVVDDIQVFEMENVSAENAYPKIFDKDLEENYYLDTVTVFTPEEGYSRYSIYTSLDGQNFDFIERKVVDAPCSKEGETYDLNGKEARFIRIFLEYNSNSPEAILRAVKFTGKKSGTPIQSPKEINIPPYEETPYYRDVTDQDTYDAVYGIIQRRLGEAYTAWFTFSLSENPKEGHTYDYFLLSNQDGKINIRGNNGVSLATGLNYYLKHYCYVNLSQVGDWAQMPREVVPVPAPVFRETKAKVRYSYNYCTLSYAMAFWGEKEWEKELDWLALNGVNLVLDATAQEEVWRRFLSGLGYSLTEIKSFVAGPAYYAWAYMANLFGFGGPVHDNWFSQRTALARKNQWTMRVLGMQPVLQGYSGMVPVDICRHDSEAEVIPQGTWCSFTRPSMLKTTSPSFKKYAKMFYAAQREVYGDYACYFATDPFHEGGNTGGMSERAIAREVLSAMLSEKEDAVWIIQSWQTNPASELLAGLSEVPDGKNHALILDLYAEKNPHHHEGKEENPHHGYSPEFDGTPWLFCMLNNFGGRLGLHGHLDNLAKNIPAAFNTREKIAGIGITPEASENNPVLYEFIFSSVWQEDAREPLEEINLSPWLYDYAKRRYGKESQNANKAWDILKDTVYLSKLNMLGQGAPECVFNARPTFEVKTASTWGNAVISYDKKDLEQAVSYMLKDYTSLKESQGYVYDLVTMLQQVLSNRIQDTYHRMVAAYKEENIHAFTKEADLFLAYADYMEEVTKASPYYMLGTWVEKAKALAKDSDDFTKKLYEINAKALITTWGSYNQSEIGKLHDYSNRQWSGLIGDFYKKRWIRWIDARKKELEKGIPQPPINWFAFEWNWVCSNTVYENVAKEVDLLSLGKTILQMS